MCKARDAHKESDLLRPAMEQEGMKLFDARSISVDRWCCFEIERSMICIDG